MKKFIKRDVEFGIFERFKISFLPKLSTDFKEKGKLEHRRTQSAACLKITFRNYKESSAFKESGENDKETNSEHQKI